MTRVGAKTSLILLDFGYAVVLWWFVKHHNISDGQVNNFFTLPLALVVITALFLYAWNVLARRLTADGPVGHRWLIFGSGAWVGVAIGVYVTLAILNAAAVTWN